MIGGLISSTLLTLVVVPVALIYIDRLAAWGKRRFSRSADAEADASRTHPEPAE